MDQNINETVNETQDATNKPVTMNDIGNKLDHLNDEMSLQTHVISVHNILFLIIGVISVVLLVLLLITVSMKTDNCNQPSSSNHYSNHNNGFNDYLDIEVKKPVIYLYPEETSNIDVYVTCDDMITTWPKADLVNEDEYHWNVTAESDGTLHQDTYEYSYIFWEGENTLNTTFDRGFCVSGEETGEFLRIVLNEMGLTPKEYNEFIVYWLPQMEHNKYNLITFSGIDSTDEYNQTYPLSVVDENGNTPDCMMRVFMSWKAVDEPVEIEPQTFTTLRRHGFTVIEWGGTEIKE